MFFAEQSAGKPKKAALSGIHRHLQADRREELVAGPEPLADRQVTGDLERLPGYVLEAGAAVACYSHLPKQLLLFFRLLILWIYH